MQIVMYWIWNGNSKEKLTLTQLNLIKALSIVLFEAEIFK